MRISDWSSDVCSSDLVGGFADVARQAEPVLAGHHDIEDDEIDRIGREPRACGIRIARLRDAKALFFKEFGERLANRALVVDEQQVRDFDHDRFAWPSAPSKGRCRTGVET